MVGFGTGALGDMACHVLHPVFKGLKLGYPTKVQGSSTLLLTDCAPNAQMVKFTSQLAIICRKLQCQKWKLLV